MAGFTGLFPKFIMEADCYFKGQLGEALKVIMDLGKAQEIYGLGLFPGEADPGEPGHQSPSGAGLFMPGCSPVSPVWARTS